ncbi:MAG: imidazole glycerol phosphate synthase subunit HisH [Chloracidobacterium sp.]|nr:imidazole glycerol phosphate synthase subunit HisH [Chloracidobacterium sp.]
MKVAIVKYNAGNSVSVANALHRLGVESSITDSTDELRQADRVIFPGVGEASSAMRYLREHKLDGVIRTLTQPVLGICLGMHLMCEFSDENSTTCLGILPYRVNKFVDDTLKIPHTGWNQIGQLQSPLFDRVAEGAWVYFVHGYYVGVGADTTAVTEYGGQFSAGLSRDNFHSLQFHPEKSGDIGALILENFLKL